MDARYLTAFLSPKKHKVAGIYLDAFCCRHAITLEAMESPFSTNNKSGRAPSVMDLILAIRVCSTKNWYDATKKPKFSERLKLNLLTMSIVRQHSAFKDFLLYMQESMSIPKVWVKSNNGATTEVKKEKVPPTLSLVVILMTKFNFTEEQAWNMPFSRAVWYSIGFVSQEAGEVDIITTEQEENEEREKVILQDIEKKAREAVKK